jgi:chromosome segregation ATPase
MPTRRPSPGQPASQPVAKAAATKATAKQAATASKASAKKATPAKRATAAKKAATAPPTRGALPAGDDDTQDVQIAKLQTSLDERTRERDDLASRLSSTEEKLSELQNSQAAMSEDLGRLREIAAKVDSVTQERVALQERLDGLQVDLPSRIQDQVASRLKDLTSAHAAELSALQQDRDRLAARVTELETPKLETARSMSTSALAAHFADVLARVAEVPPPSPDAPYAASVTALSVSAKGVLRASDTGEVELVTPDPGAVPAEELSTLNLDLKLLPRLGSPPPAT